MGLKHREYLTSDHKVFGCHKCRTHLSIAEFIESKNFNGQHGRAFLFTTVVNINEGPAEDRPMTTGLHTVRDITCAKCNELLGWKYDKAYEQSQKYKEGKFILEKAMTGTSWCLVFVIIQRLMSDRWSPRTVDVN